eukprot:7229696-Pyramimonas_sp.AAC.1
MMRLQTRRYTPAIDQHFVDMRSAIQQSFVQNLIERCLQLYMTRRDVVSTLQHQAKIEPGFTSLGAVRGKQKATTLKLQTVCDVFAVWKKLEEQNPEFFRAYYTRLKIKDQIVLFNQLLEQHAQLMQKVNSNVPGKPPTAQKGHGTFLNMRLADALVY